MHPFINITLFDVDLSLSTALVLDAFAILFAFPLFYAFSRGKIPLRKQIGMVVGISLGAWIGARLFHVAWERPDYYRAHPTELLTSFEGMTFYGALLGGGLALFVFGKLGLDRRQRLASWDFAAIYTAFFYGILRLGCFAEGCCWGKLCVYPWAVRYKNGESEMPFFGLPVHPVQLYDAFLGFALCALLVTLYRKHKEYRGRLFLVFCAFYSLGRFFTEFFRGDAYRGTHWLFSLSTSQVLSITLFIVSTGVLISKSISLSRKKSFAFVVVTLFIFSGCVLPYPPHSSVATLATAKLPPGLRKSAELYEISPGNAAIDERITPLPPNRGLILVALDESFQTQFSKELKAAYRTENEVRIEEVVWWALAPALVGLYGSALRISYRHFSSETLLESILYFEKTGKPYDVLLLTHGIPNHIVTTKGNPLISWREIGAWRGRFPHFELLFLQSCYGNSLAEDWLSTGAKAVVSYPGLNRNFFYPFTFLSQLRKEIGRLRVFRSPDERLEKIKRAYLESNRKIADDIRKSRRDRLFIESLGLSIAEYLNEAPNPEWRSRSASE